MDEERIKRRSKPIVSAGDNSALSPNLEVRKRRTRLKQQEEHRRADEMAIRGRKRAEKSTLRKGASYT